MEIKRDLIAIAGGVAAAMIGTDERMIMDRKAAMFLALAAPLAIAAAEAPQAAPADLTAFADAFDAAQIAKDGAALERMVADDLVFIDGDGARHGKREFIAGWTGPDEQYDPVTLSDRVVVPLGRDAGLASADAILSGRSAGQPFRTRIRFTDVFRRGAHGWQAVHIQVTRLPPPKDAAAAR